MYVLCYTVKEAYHQSDILLHIIMLHCIEAYFQGDILYTHYHATLCESLQSEWYTMCTQYNVWKSTFRRVYYVCIVKHCIEAYIQIDILLHTMLHCIGAYIEIYILYTHYATMFGGLHLD